MFLASMLLVLYLGLYNYCKHLSQKIHFKDNSTPVGLEADGNKELVKEHAMVISVYQKRLIKTYEFLEHE